MPAGVPDRRDPVRPARRARHARSPRMRRDRARASRRSTISARGRARSTSRRSRTRTGGRVSDDAARPRRTTTLFGRHARARAAAQLADRVRASARLAHAAARRAASRYTVATGIGVWGNNIPVGVGVRDHQLRLVDRYRPRRHVHLGDPATCSSRRWRNLDQPAHRDDDDLRGHPGRPVPAAPPRPAVVRVLAVPLSRRRWACGRNVKSARCRGTPPRSRRTSRSRCCSGISACSPISRRCAITRRRAASRIIYGLFALGWRGDCALVAALQRHLPDARRRSRRRS